MTHRLKRARELAGLTRGQAASLSFDAVWYEDGDGQPPEDVMATTTRLYGASRCWLLGHDDQLIPAVAVKALDDSTATGKDRDVIVEVLASLSSCRACKI